MEKETGLPTQLGNDANLMGLGETMYGAGNGATHVVFLTVGTGIGGAVIIDWQNCLTDTPIEVLNWDMSPCIANGDLAPAVQ